MQAAKKKMATKVGARPAATARPKAEKVEKYTGLFVEVTRVAASSKAKKALARGTVLFAIGEPDGEWLPVLVLGRRDAVKRADVRRIAPKAAKKATTPSARRAAVDRVQKRAGVKITARDAERISARWER